MPRWAKLCDRHGGGSDCDAAQTEEWSNIPSFVLSVLQFLGLAKEADLDCVPTPRLRALVCKRRQEERHQPDEEHLPE
jgi:hypothetical protein